MHPATRSHPTSPVRGPGRNPRGAARGQHGFTLLEILVALAILALSLGILLQLLSRNLQSAGYSEEYSRAVMLARMKMEEMLVRESPVPAILAGDLEGGYVWSAQWRPTDPADAEKLAPFELSVTVQWGKSERPKQIHLSTIKLFPIPERQP
jgi:general secretion pathway protein I